MLHKEYLYANIRLENGNLFSESERLCTTSDLRSFFSVFFGGGAAGESKTVFGGDTMPTARQISK